MIDQLSARGVEWFLYSSLHQYIRIFVGLGLAHPNRDHASWHRQIYTTVISGLRIA